MRPHLGPAICIVLLALLLGGCADTPPTRFYVLSAMSDQAAPAPGKGIAIGIGPVTLPQYLNRPQIVTRIGGNRLDFAEFDQWGGDLNDNVTRVLAANLSSLLKTDRVSLYPWKAEAPIDEQVTIDVVSFEQDVDGSSVLTAYWSIVDPKRDEVKLMRKSTFRDSAGTASPVAATQPSARPGDQAQPYDAIVSGMSRNLEALSRDIAGAVVGLKGK
jgi:uncharacterized protein